MDVRSISKYLRVSPFKAREITRAIQGLHVNAALDLLTFTPRKSAELVRKTLKSAIANAENNHEMSVENLFVKSAFVGEGPTLKRFMPRARGSAGAIRKRSSHITVIVSDEDIPRPNRPGKKARVDVSPGKVKETAE
jgi:large subunit ribosomal protein L22